MINVSVYGVSDDLIELGGSIREEFTYDNEEAPYYLAFSDGTVLSIAYEGIGGWVIRHVAKGDAQVIIHQVPPDQEDIYSDVATLIGELRWVTVGTDFVRAK